MLTDQSKRGNKFQIIQGINIFKINAKQLHV